jgi:hypothetical protein
MESLARSSGTYPKVQKFFTTAATPDAFVRTRVHDVDRVQRVSVLRRTGNGTGTQT